MKLAVVIAIGGAMGALGRHFLAGYVTQLVGSSFPWGIFVVNVIGSIFIGVITELAGQASFIGEELKTLLVIGFLGAFTTFSTFSLDIVELCQKGLWTSAAIYVVGSVCLAVLGLVMAMMVTRGIMA